MIYLLRHGETAWNVEGRFQGQADSPLTERGRSQVRAVGRLLKARIPDPEAFAVVSSPLGRAWASACLLCEVLGLDPAAIRAEPRLMEHAFGLWEGLTVAEIRARFPGEWERRRAAPWDYLVPGGESYRLLAARVAAWLDEQPAEAALLVVCHGMTGRVLRGLYAGLAEAEILALAEPQTSAFRLAGGRVEELEAAPGASANLTPRP